MEFNDMLHDLKTREDCLEMIRWINIDIDNFSKKSKKFKKLSAKMRGLSEDEYMRDGMADLLKRREAVTERLKKLA